MGSSRIDVFRVYRGRGPEFLFFIGFFVSEMAWSLVVAFAFLSIEDTAQWPLFLQVLGIVLGTNILLRLLRNLVLRRLEIRFSDDHLTIVYTKILFLKQKEIAIYFSQIKECEIVIAKMKYQSYYLKMKTNDGKSYCICDILLQFKQMPDFSGIYTIERVITYYERYMNTASAIK